MKIKANTRGHALRRGGAEGSNGSGSKPTPSVATSASAVILSCHAARRRLSASAAARCSSRDGAGSGSYPTSGGGDQVTGFVAMGATNSGSGGSSVSVSISRGAASTTSGSARSGVRPLPNNPPNSPLPCGLAGSAAAGSASPAMPVAPPCRGLSPAPASLTDGMSRSNETSSALRSALPASWPRYCVAWLTLGEAAATASASSLACSVQSLCAISTMLPASTVAS